ncbi:uncharacterized protein Ecym_6110 [Eremothecium cymbalariae DBVPG|uniref:Glycoside hydrolase family 17 protein n=1 Tax=Eremothecium cymbalariae (strain CBS 270.75 / DBVPG 7215 / KCTC 17166 / NRRL Y-17582) TaxID=931890 RepID=G8JV25_ERECY|nr:hypothetical protein Ecym_6110 [Eremothecium cymbalariae DBVPG\
MERLFIACLLWRAGWAANVVEKRDVTILLMDGAVMQPATLVTTTTQTISGVGVGVGGPFLAPQGYVSFTQPTPAASASVGAPGAWIPWDMLGSRSGYGAASGSSSWSSAADSTSSTSSTTVSATRSSLSRTSSQTSASSSSSSSSWYGRAKGISYSPYQRNGACKPRWQVKSDIRKLSGFDILRIYDPDCDVVSNLLSAMATHQKLLLGIYNVDRIAESIGIVDKALRGDFSKIYAVSVGNELVNDGKVSPAQIKTALDTARALLGSIGYTGPVVSVDTLVAVEAHKDLCGLSDFIAVNVHPFWDGHVDPYNCGTWLQKQVENLVESCGNGKPILITETGWPTSGAPFGSNMPNKVNQDICIDSILTTIGQQVLLFTMYNDYWKSPGSYGVEQFWGIFGDDSDS